MLWIFDYLDFSIAENSQPYTKSKILAEKAAWDYVKENNNFELVVINPGIKKLFLIILKTK